MTDQEKIDYLVNHGWREVLTEKSAWRWQKNRDTKGLYRLEAAYRLQKDMETHAQKSL